MKWQQSRIVTDGLRTLAALCYLASPFLLVFIAIPSLRHLLAAIVSTGWRYGAPPVGLALGLYSFFKASKLYRRLRGVKATPLEPVGSIAMRRSHVSSNLGNTLAVESPRPGVALGLAHAHGKATSAGEYLTSPVSKSPCFYYEVRIKAWGGEWVKGGRYTSYRSWSDSVTCAQGVNFYLQDTTGTVLVNPTDAECDLLVSARREALTGWRWIFRYLAQQIGGAEPPTGATEEELLDLAKRAVPHSSPLKGCRVKEYCLLPGHWYDLIGTCVENPNSKDEHDRNMVLKGKEQPTFFISWRSPKEVEGALLSRAQLYILAGAAITIPCVALLLRNLGLL